MSVWRPNAGTAANVLHFVHRLRGWGFALGVAATLCLMVAHLNGGLVDFENWAYDQRMRLFNTVPESDRIVHIDLTDESFDLIDSWPWPRRRHADLIDTLTELGAVQIGFDIEFKRPKPQRVVPLSGAGAEEPPASGVRYFAEQGPMGLHEWVDDDAELAAAVQRAGNCFIPLSFPMLPPGKGAEELRRQARELLREAPQVSEAEFAEALGVQRILGRYPKLQFQIAELLREEFSLSQSEVAARLGVSAELVE